MAWGTKQSGCDLFGKSKEIRPLGKKKKKNKNSIGENIPRQKVKVVH